MILSPKVDRPTPVIIAGLDGISGVSAWSFRLREALKDHPRYRIVLVNCRETGNKIGHFDYTAPSQTDLRELLLNLAPAIVLPNFIWPVFDVCANLIAEGVDLRCIGFCRADSEPEYYNPLAWYEPLITQFAAVSPECAARLVQRLPHREHDIAIMPTGISVPPSLDRTYSTAPLRLVYGGRIVQQQKRVLDFIPLVARLLDSACNFQFDIVGQGRQLGELKSAMANLDHGGRVRFIGKLPPSAMDALWREHDVFIQTSNFEGTSNSMLESMAQGAVPVVTQTDSGIAGIIEHGANGFVVPVGDMSAMAEILCELAEDKASLETLGRAAHAAARPYAMDIYAEKFVRLLDATMAAPLRAWPESRASERRPDIEGLDLPASPPLDPSLVSRVASRLVKNTPRIEQDIPRQFAAPETLVVVAAADDNFAMPLAAMVKSVLCNLSPDRRMLLYVIDGGLGEELRSRLLESWSSDRLLVRWLQPEFSTLQRMKVTGHVNLLTYSRLLIPALLPYAHRKALYLDCDIIVRGDLGEIWDQDMGDRHLLAVQDMTAPWMCSETALANFEACRPYLSAAEALTNYRELNIPPHTKYFNAGLLLLNLEKWRATDAARRIIEYLRDNPDQVRWWDQDGLNAILHRDWGELDLPWNQIPHIFRYPSWRESPFSEADYKAITELPKAIHYSARSKPWHGDNTHPARDVFFHYLDQTAWVGWRPEAPLALAKNGEFASWDGTHPEHWLLLEGTRIEPSSESRRRGTSAKIDPGENNNTAGLEQRLAVSAELAGARLSISLDARCADRHALALNVHITTSGKRKTHRIEHPGHGAWATLRHEIDLPHDHAPTTIQCAITLRPAVTAPALVENFRAHAFLKAPMDDNLEWEVPRAVDLRRPVRRRWNPTRWIAGATRPQPRKNSTKCGNPVYSVILSNYNGAKFLEEALLSVARQEHDAFEFIIVDDASADNSPEIILRVAKQYPNHIRTIFKEQNEGQAAGFNDGFDMAYGDIICFIDSDDCWFPDKLSNLARLIEVNPGCAIYQHNLYKLMEGKVTDEKFRDLVQTGDLLGYTKRTRHFPYFVPTTGLAFSREALERVMPIPPAFRVCADGFLTRTTLCFGPIASTNECWGAYRVHGGNNVFENPDHDSFAYTNGLLIPTLNAFYQANGIDLSFEVKAGKKSAGLAPRVRATNRSLMTKILDSSIRELLREVRRRLPFG
jgi:lipopolysaccharide biosynthesis glycosyltransferase/glycosyltransferase involved in cell wall biosynthesis